MIPASFGKKWTNCKSFYQIIDLDDFRSFVQKVRFEQRLVRLNKV